MNHFLKIIFYISALILIAISLYPGSLIIFLLYNSLEQQANLPSSIFETTINHFFSYFYLSLLGFFLYLRGKYSQKIVYGLFFLALILEFLQIMVPNRLFELNDLIANISGVFVAYLTIKIYLLFKKL